MKKTADYFLSGEKIKNGRARSIQCAACRPDIGKTLLSDPGSIEEVLK